MEPRSKWAEIRRQAMLGAIVLPGLTALITFLSQVDLAAELVAEPVRWGLRLLALAVIGALSGAGLAALSDRKPDPAA